MAAPGDEDGIFARLRQKVDPKIEEQRQRDHQARLAAQQAKAQARQEELVGFNASRPVTISSVRVEHATNTRRGFLERIVGPVLSINQDRPYTFQEALSTIGQSANKLERLDIFKDVSTYIDLPDKSEPSTTPTDLSVTIAAHERGRYSIRTGTEAGSAEGSAFFDAKLRNLFGGAESLNVHASLGTRTRSAYSAFFDTPILSSPDFRFEVGGLASSTIKPWASHEEVLKGGSARLKFSPSPISNHDFSYSGLWRQITSLSPGASPSVRADAGDSFKSSISHTWTHDARDSPQLPTRGFLLKTISEVAGLGLLGGDVSFAKVQAESQIALPLATGISFTAGFRTGLLYPLPLSSSSPSSPSMPVPSRLNDRFQLGGPTDVRGFRLSGLGPRDGQDALGGDVFAAGGASLLFPVPTFGADTPLRIQTFINAGRLLALRGPAALGAGDKRKAPVDTEKDWDQAGVNRSVRRAVSELTQGGWPSASAGIGLVYAHPVARFELNFSVPLVVRKGEEGRKGLSFGVGVDFM